jgi:hypothetical protein
MPTLPTLAAEELDAIGTAGSPVELMKYGNGSRLRSSRHMWCRTACHQTRPTLLRCGFVAAHSPMRSIGGFVAAPFPMHPIGGVGWGRLSHKHITNMQLSCPAVQLPQVSWMLGLFFPMQWNAAFPSMSSTGYPDSVIVSEEAP